MRMYIMKVVFPVLFLGSSFAFGEASLSDPRTTWRVGVAEFAASGLSSENAYLRASYPLLIREKLGRLKEHTYADDEIAAYRKAILAHERDRLGKLLDAALLSRDGDFLRGALTGQAGAAKRVDELVGSIERLDTFELEKIDIPAKKRVELVSAANSPLLPAVTGSPAAYARSNNLDLLVFGTIEEIETYLFVDIHLYSDAFGRLPTLKTAFSRERLTEGSQNVFHSLTRTVLGREWAEVAITASEETGEIYFDGVFKGIGSVTLDYVKTGEHLVVVKAIGHREYRETLLLGAGDEVAVSADLIPVIQPAVTLSSVPPGADLYARSQWYGKTPVEVAPDFINLQGTMRKDGYQETLIPSIPKDTGLVEIKLLPDKFDRRTIIKDEREGFYKVLAAFILSVPFPVFFFDATNTLTQSYIAEAGLPPFQRNLEEAQRLLKMRQICLSAYIATAFVSAALFVDATLELLEYIDRVQLTTY